MTVTDRPREAFRSSFLPVFAIVFAAATAAFLASALYRHGLAGFGSRLWLAVALTAGICLALTLFAVALFPVYVGPAGLRAYTFWGNYRTVPWADAATVGRFNLLGLRYLTVTPPAGGRLYVPLFLSDMAGFRAKVREFAGAAHPVAAALGG